MCGAIGGGSPKLFFNLLCVIGSGQTWAIISGLREPGETLLSLKTFECNIEDMTDERPHPTAGRERRHKSPAVHSAMHNLHLPSLPDHLRTDVDGPSCSDEEEGAKRLRSTSTTPRSARGTEPDEHDRIMGVNSVGCRETIRFGEENVPDLNETQKHVEDELHDDANLGVDETLGGYGSASLIECLGRFGAQPNTSTPATCPSEGGQEVPPPYQTNPPQVSFEGPMG